MTDEPVKLDEATRLQLREKAKSSLYFMAKGVLGFDKLNLRIHGPVCELLQDQRNTRLGIELPRSWYKSTIGSIAYPIWCAVNNPNIRIAIVQNTHANACKKLSVIKEKFEKCALLRCLFPELIPTSDCLPWSAEALKLPRTGSYSEATFEAASTRTKLTSRHYNKIIEDDTVSPDLDDMTESGVLLPSPDDVSQAIGWHKNVLPLLDEMKTDQILIIGTRWFERDLISVTKEEEKQYKWYSRAVRETNGFADEAGELTYPERFDDEILRQLEKAMGPYLYSCLYLNKPIRSGDMIFNPEWITYYETPPRDLITYTTVDPAGDPEETIGDPDYNVVLTAGKDLQTGRIYVLEYTRKRCNVGELIHDVFDHVRKYHPVRVGVEKLAASNHAYLIKERMRKDDLYFAVEVLTHGRKSKNMRIQALQPLVKGKDLLFRTHHRELVSELLAFPLAKYDDVGDALSMQLPMWALTRSKQEEKDERKARDPLSFDSLMKEMEQQSTRESQGHHAYLTLS